MLLRCTLVKVQLRISLTPGGVCFALHEVPLVCFSAVSNAAFAKKAIVLARHAHCNTRMLEACVNIANDTFTIIVVIFTTTFISTPSSSSLLITVLLILF